MLNKEFNATLDSLMIVKTDIQKVNKNPKLVIHKICFCIIPFQKSINKIK